MMRKRLFLSMVAVLAVASVGAGVRATNAASTSSAAQSDTLVFTGHLTSSQVVAGSTSTATGTATIQIDTVLKTLTTDLVWSGLSGPADRSHVHSGAEGTPTDDIFFHEVIQEEDRTVVPCPWLDAVFENCVPTSGSLHDVLDVSDGHGCTDFQCVVDTAVPNGFYIDMHTEKYPGGEIRGQLVLVEPKIVFSEDHKSKLKKGHKAHITFALTDANGVPISDAEAAGLLAPTCRVNFSASGAQEVAPTCVEYDAGKHQFTYDWKLGKQTGEETITVTVSYPSTSKTTTNSQSMKIKK
jgi:hypothetical protein